uniref:Uncharacterized protein n=1 Tax=Acrobeloides nanus TaxID=290746 RepID=A0A914EM10_9BILA
MTGAFAHAQRNALEPGDSTCLRHRKPNLDAPGPTLLNLQDRTVRWRTERTMLLPGWEDILSRSSSIFLILKVAYKIK